MTDRERALDGAVGRRKATVRVRGVEDTGPFPGRHASRTEIAAETPIFHALTVGGWRGRQTEQTARQAPARRPGRRSAEALDDFRRDPLTAPIPVQAYTALTTRTTLPTPPVQPPMPQPVPQSVPQPVPQSVSQPVRQSVRQPEPAPVSAGYDRAPLYAAHVPTYAPAAPAYTSLTDTGPQALGELSSRTGRHHRRAVGSGSGHHHLAY
ncbi:hypothetical protein LWC35_23930 [Pseudonocardia kujensis]|uniref:hypothetical protein n=1 Tax=Pseudonocardia kujensis TaxID=1128675 RepID=UPI001E5B5D92|nr:hypothetical protein [Pseudonocardia kujensis]MCE0765933.1 hypothetical protein [Pseudonocardia kujensis]